VTIPCDGKHHDLLQSLGLGDLHVAMGALPRSAYEQGLNAILVGNAVTRTLDDAAATFEQVRSRIGKLTTQDGVRPVQLPCFAARTMCEFLSALAAWICALAWVQPEVFAPLCALTWVEAATACFIAWAEGCPE
jgi:hypothetical protein